jgi:hypothetical protein
MDTLTEHGIISRLDAGQIQSELDRMLPLATGSTVAAVEALRRWKIPDKDINLILDAASMTWGAWMFYDVLLDEEGDLMAKLISETAKLNGEELSDELSRTILLQVMIQLLRFMVQATKAPATLEALAKSAKKKGFGG